VRKETVIHLHGFASSARSAKARYLAERFSEFPEVRFLIPDFNPTPGDFKYLTITGMINRLRQWILDHELDTFSMIGSSMGGLVALHYAQRFGGTRRLLLLAPLLSYRSLPLNGETLAGWQKQETIEVFHYGFNEKVLLRRDFHLDALLYHEQIPPAVPISVIHGRKDDVIPLEHSRDYAAKYPAMVAMKEVDSDHTLLDHLDFIWGQVKSMLDLPRTAK